jgi:putative FmdB family regulatory protein
MPTYQYRCAACKHEFDELQSIKEPPLTKCPKCKKKKLNRLMGTGAGLIFKGSGFYITDYRSESYKSAAKAEAGHAESGSKGEGKSDAAGKGESTGKHTDKADSAKKSTGASSSEGGKGGKIHSSGTKGKSD